MMVIPVPAGLFPSGLRHCADLDKVGDCAALGMLNRAECELLVARLESLALIGDMRLVFVHVRPPFFAYEP